MGVHSESNMMRIIILTLGAGALVLGAPSGPQAPREDVPMDIKYKNKDKQEATLEEKLFREGRSEIDDDRDRRPERIAEPERRRRDLANNISWLDVLEGVNSVVSAISKFETETLVKDKAEKIAEGRPDITRYMDESVAEDGHRDGRDE